jgi:TonB family protein
MSRSARASEAATAAPADTANDRFKRRFQVTYWNSITAAVVVHFLVFVVFPRMSAADAGVDAHVMDAIRLPPVVDIPPPPERIARPATPVISASADVDVTLPVTSFSATPSVHLAPPTTGVTSDHRERAVPFTPFTVAPMLRNRDDVARALERSYPALLRDAGIGGTTHVWIHLDREGRVTDRRIDASSGQQSLDDVALRVVELMQFTPARNRDQLVAVWVSIPIRFISRD